MRYLNCNETLIASLLNFPNLSVRRIKRNSQFSLVRSLNAFCDASIQSNNFSIVHNKLKKKLGTLPPEVPYYSAEDVPDKWRKSLGLLVCGMSRFILLL